MASTDLRTAVLFSVSSTARAGEGVGEQQLSRIVSHAGRPTAVCFHAIAARVSACWPAGGGGCTVPQPAGTHSRSGAPSARTASSPLPRPARAGAPARAPPPPAHAVASRPAAPVAPRGGAAGVGGMVGCGQLVTACLAQHTGPAGTSSAAQTMHTSAPASPPPAPPAPRPAHQRRRPRAAGCPPARAPAGRSACGGAAGQGVLRRSPAAAGCTAPLPSQPAQRVPSQPRAQHPPARAVVLGCRQLDQRCQQHRDEVAAVRGGRGVPPRRVVSKRAEEVEQTRLVRRGLRSGGSGGAGGRVWGESESQQAGRPAVSEAAAAAELAVRRQACPWPPSARRTSATVAKCFMATSSWSHVPTASAVASSHSILE